jgi:hypothetical protein
LITHPLRSDQRQESPVRALRAQPQVESYGCWPDLGRPGAEIPCSGPSGPAPSGILPLLARSWAAGSRNPLFGPFGPSPKWNPMAAGQNEPGGLFAWALRAQPQVGSYGCWPNYWNEPGGLFAWALRAQPQVESHGCWPNSIIVSGSLAHFGPSPKWNPMAAGQIPLFGLFGPSPKWNPMAAGQILGGREQKSPVRALRAQPQVPWPHDYVECVRAWPQVQGRPSPSPLHESAPPTGWRALGLRGLAGRLRTQRGPYSQPAAKAVPQRKCG